MDDTGWQRSRSSRHMLAEILPHDAGFERKVRLLTCACFRVKWHLFGAVEQQAIEVAERFADGNVGPAELQEAHRETSAVSTSHSMHRACWATTNAAPHDMMIAARVVDADVRCDLLRDVFANPFRPVSIDAAWLSWHDGTVRSLAQAAYDERALPAGHLEAGRLAVLADALEEAGCTNADVLAHLRGPGPHVRGCWAVDLLLGKQ